MTRYQKGTMGKLVVQDWSVVTGYSDTPMLYILTAQQAAALISLAETLYWLKRWINPPGQDTLDAFTAETIFNLMNPITCEMLNACLAPAFEALQDQLEALQEAVEANATSERTLTQSTVENELCGGAASVVDAMFQTFVETYNETEAAPLDNFAEFLVAFLKAIPIISELPFDDMIAAVNWYFENQFLDFTTDFDDIRDTLICDLKCFVETNDNEFTWDVWADWLEFVGAAYPSNRAAQGFARYSPFRQTWLNQIAALINRDASLQSYFDTLSAAWESGLLNPTVCVDCACPDGEVRIYNDFARTNLKLTIPYVLGVPFTVNIVVSEWGSDEWFAVWDDFLDYSYDVTVGTYTATIGETPYAYIDNASAVISGTFGNPATDLPNPGTARGIFMNANELDSTDKEIEVTLTAP